VSSCSTGIEWVMTEPVKESGSARTSAWAVGPASTAMVSADPTNPAASVATRSRAALIPSRG